MESLSSGADGTQRLLGILYPLDAKVASPDHLNKPFSSKELILRVHSHLQLAAIRSELELRVSERTAALEESKETFQRLSELLQVGVHRSNRAGEIIWANRKWFAVLGLEDGNWDGAWLSSWPLWYLSYLESGWATRIHPDDLAMATKYYQHAVETGESYPYPIEMRLLGHGDTIVDITYELQAERSVTGECIGFVGVFSDVSMLRKLERERVALEQSRREEAEQNRQLQEHFIDARGMRCRRLNLLTFFSQVTCHELRNPLNAISNSAELLGESLNRFLANIDANAQLQEVLGPVKSDLREDLDAVETILLSSRHQKRIADGKAPLLSRAPLLSLFLQMSCIYQRSPEISCSS